MNNIDLYQGQYPVVYNDFKEIVIKKILSRNY